jgi:N12 class adenine-specific DNA methylase
VNDVSRSEIDAKIALAITELRVELANISGKIDSLSARIDGHIDIAMTRIDSLVKDANHLWSGMKFVTGTIITVGLALAGLLGPILWLLIKATNKTGAMG